MKKFLSIVLTLVLCFGLLSVVAYAEDTYVVAGTAGLCGSEWKADDTANAMTLEGAVYKKVYSNVAAGDYQFKVVKNGSEWIGNGQANFMFTVSTACDVTITYNPADNTVTYTGDGVGKTVFKCDAVYAVGNGSGNWLNGEDWNNAAESNKMTANNGVYSITYSKVPAGEYEFKFAADGGWDKNWGSATVEFGKYVDITFNGDNIKLSLTEEADVTLYLDLSNFSTEKGGAKMAVALNGATPEGGSNTGDNNQGGDNNQNNNNNTGNNNNNTGNNNNNTGSNNNNNTQDKTYTLNIQVPASWTKVMAYTWDPEDYGTWPGTAMQKSGDWYSTTMKGSMKNLVISDGTDNKKTENITLPGNKNVWIVVKDEVNANGKYVHTLSDKQPAGTGNTGSNNNNNTNNGGSSINDIKVDGTPSEYCVVGSADFMGNWDVKSEKGRMNMVEPNLYRVKFKNVPKGEYEMKIVKNKNWETSWGDNKNNFKFTVAQTGDIVVTFKLNGDQGLITVQGVNVVGTADIPMIGFVVLMVLAATTTVVLVVNRKKFI